MGPFDKPLRRSDTRSEVAALTIRGLVQCPGMPNTPCMLWDISDNGLRLWSPDKLPPGSRITVTVAKPFVLTMTAEVRWCRSLQNTDGFYAGVRVLDHSNRLEALHRALAEEVAKESGALSLPSRKTVVTVGPHD